MLADALQKGEKEEPGVHYRVDEKQKSVLMTDEGYEECEEALGVSNLLALPPQARGWLLASTVTNQSSCTSTAILTCLAGKSPSQRRACKTS